MKHFTGEPELHRRRAIELAGETFRTSALRAPSSAIGSAS